MSKKTKIIKATREKWDKGQMATAIIITIIFPPMGLAMWIRKLFKKPVFI